jgi:hypothetical protein
VSIRILIEILAMAGVFTLGSLLTLANHKLVHKVNAQSPQELDSLHFAGDLMKMLHLHREYQRLFPDGKLHIQIRVMVALLFACMLVGAVAVRVL